MKLVGTTFCSADAHASIKEITKYILESKGGDGVSREIFDHLTQVTKNKLSATGYEVLGGTRTT